MSDSPRKEADSDADDDLGLDESLSSMRSMWREMRDEEPSDRGMAALLAAAREKAEEMKPKRSWFAALLDQLRRPPVLAMATAVVLIGGAVVISQRGDEMKTESERVSSAPVIADNQGAPPEPAPESEPPAVAAPGGNMNGALDGDAESEKAAVEEVEGGALSAKKRPAVRPRPPSASGTTTRDVDSFSMVPEKPADTRPAPTPTAKNDAPPLELAIGDEDDMAPRSGAAQSSAEPPKSVSRKPLPSIEGEDRAAKDTTVAQLVKQCEAAAAKNDCGAVRTLAQRIARQDPSTYKNRLLKNTNVARCLEPPAPMDAAEEPAK